MKMSLPLPPGPSLSYPHRSCKVTCVSQTPSNSFKMGSTWQFRPRAQKMPSWSRERSTSRQLPSRSTTPWPPSPRENGGASLQSSWMVRPGSSRTGPTLWTVPLPGTLNCSYASADTTYTFKIWRYQSRYLSGMCGHWLCKGTRDIKIGPYIMIFGQTSRHSWKKRGLLDLNIEL